jgi:tetratricopeptide (TPR) repeat protein
VGETLNHEASLVRAQGDLDHAEGLLRNALAISEQSGDRRARARSLTVLAGILRSRADMAGAQKLYEESLAVSEESGDKRAATLAHTNLGNVMNNSGHPEPAKEHYRQALALAHETGDQKQLSIAMGNLAIVAYSEGDLAGAKKALEEVLDLKRQIGDQGSYAYSLIHLGNVLLFQGDIAGARKAWTEQCRINEAAGEKIALANCRLCLADLDLREGHPDAVDPVAGKVAAEFSTVNPAADAWKLLAEAALLRGDLKGAQDAARKAMQLAQKSPNGADYGIPIAITAAKIDAASGRTSEAVVSLNDSLARARSLHLVGLQLSARLSLCEIKKNPQEIAQLEQDARSMGFGLVAQNAAGLKSNLK